MKNPDRGDNSETQSGQPSLSRRTFLTQTGTGIASTLALSGVSHANSHAKSSPPAKPSLIASDSATVVETISGKVRGYERRGVYIFKGIPYGASTSGANRFMPAKSPEPWPGIRNALQYGRVCPSRDYNHFDYDGKNLDPTSEDFFLLHRGEAVAVPGEDCLRLNLWTPEINGSRKRPVMVYMHGGGYSGGSGHDLLSYEGESLARNHDVVLVNHNHRLNVLGYLNLRSFGDQYASSANVGMLDLVSLLQWVRQNISRFGGDPDNVTIFGQSGGGGKVINLMAMPSAQGLYHRAIVQSGPFLKALTPEYSDQVAHHLLKELNLSPSQVNKLHDIPMDKLQGAAAEALRKMPASDPAGPLRTFGTTGWGPTVDGTLLPHHPFDPQAPSISADVPLITGTNLNEFVNGLDNRDAQKMTFDELNAKTRAWFGGRAQAILDAYRTEYPKASAFDLYALIDTACCRRPSFEQAARKAALNKAPAYVYIYSWRTPLLDDRPGTFHAAEIGYTFDNGEICDHYSGGLPSALRLSRQMGRAWTSFARTGDPNHSEMPSWPVYTLRDRAVMSFNDPSIVRKDPEGAGLRLIEDLA